MKHNLQILILFICVFTSGKAHAFIFGGDIQYQVRNKDTIDVTVTVYRNCRGPNMAGIQLDLIGIACSYTVSYTNIQPSMCADVTPICPKYTSRCDSTTCNTYGYPNGSNSNGTYAYGIEKLVYYKTIVISNTNCCKFRLEMSYAARYTSITTCCSGQNFFTYAEFNRCYNLPNTSPKSNYDPMQIVCKGNCVSMNLGAVDTSDYDSISYHMSQALSGFGSPCTYQSPYTYQYPLQYDGFPSIKHYNKNTCKGWSLDSTTGDLYFKPMAKQVATIVIDIKEWRRDTTNNKMVNIGLTRRDFTIIVDSNCTNKSPQLPSVNIAACIGDKVCFTGIQSSDPDTADTVRLEYNGGIPKAIFSTQFNGSAKEEFTLCWQTDSNDTLSRPYIFSIAAKDDACPLNLSTSKTYSILLGRHTPTATYKITHIACGKVKLESTPTNAKYGDKFTYTWTVSGKKYIGKDTTVRYDYDSSNIIQLDIDNNGCITTYYDTLYYLPKSLKLDIGADTIVCERVKVVLKAKTSGGFPQYKYLWNTGYAKDTLDSCTITINAFSKIICKVTDTFGCKKYDTIIIKVYTSSKLYVPSDTACQGDTLIFDAGKSFSSYQWIDLTNNNTISKVRYLYTITSGNFAIHVTDTNGCADSSTTSAVIKIPKPVSIQNQRKCNGETIIFDAGANYNSYVWKDYTTNNIVSQTRTLIAVISQKFIIYTTDSNTCTASDTVEAIFNPAIVLSKQFAHTVCQHDTVKLQAWGADYIEWRDISDTTLLYTGDTFYHSFDTSTRLVLTGYTTTAGITCYASDTISIGVLPSPIISVQSKYIVCAGDKLTIKVVSQKQYSYLWNTGKKNDYIFTSQVGNYSVTATDTNGCKTTLAASLENFPMPNLSLSVSNDTLYSSYTGSQFYTWNRDNIFEVVTVKPWYYVTQTGSYKVIIIDSNGCSDTSAILQVSALKSGFETLDYIQGFKIYPNPSTGIYYIESTSTINVPIAIGITIYDLMGKQVYKNSSNNNIIDLSDKPEGIYLLQINKNIWLKLSKL